MTVTQAIIREEYAHLAQSDKKMNRSYLDTENARFDLWDSATGGCFQQAHWSPCPERVTQAARAVGRIVQSFP